MYSSKLKKKERDKRFIYRLAVVVDFRELQKQGATNFLPLKFDTVKIVFRHNLPPCL